MLANSRGQPVVTKIANDHPKLERAKPAAKLNPVVRAASHFFLFWGAQIFWHQRKCASQKIQMTAIEHRTIERCKEPFVRVKHQRVRPLTTIEHLSHLANDRG